MEIKLERNSFSPCGDFTQDTFGLVNRRSHDSMRSVEELKSWSLDPELGTASTSLALWAKDQSCEAKRERGSQISVGEVPAAMENKLEKNSVSPRWDFTQDTFVPVNRGRHDSMRSVEDHVRWCLGTELDILSTSLALWAQDHGCEAKRERGSQISVGEVPAAMEKKLEKNSVSPRGDFTQDTFVLVNRRRQDSMRSVEKHVRWSLDTELRIALTSLINLESAEPFLCDHHDHGLLGLRTIEHRLAKGRYVDAKMFWSDVDECLSICPSSGRHPFMVWEMRTASLQLAEDLNVDGCLNEGSLALGSFPSLASPDFSRLLHHTLQGLDDTRLPTNSSLCNTVLDACEAVFLSALASS